MRIDTVLTHRKDLQSFFAKETGDLVRQEQPDFGEQIKRWDEFDNLKRSAKPCFNYYCGFAADVHFNKNSRSDKKIWLLPIRQHEICLPQVGEMIMGQTEIGPESPRFIWWDVASPQDQRFQQIMLGRLTYSSIEKYEAKLTVEIGEHADRRLFLAVMALYFRDADFFIKLMKRGMQVCDRHNHYCDIDLWLSQFISPLLPDFWENFKHQAGLDCARAA